LNIWTTSDIIKLFYLTRFRKKEIFYAREVINIYNLLKYKWAIAIIIMILVAIGGIAYKNTIYSTQILSVQEESLPKTAPKEEEAAIVEEKAPSMITVYVCGSVKNPSNVTLEAASRVEDAILLAGGLEANADVNGINMAQRLADEDMIYVPQKGETVQGPGKTAAAASNSAGDKKAAKLNINRATLSEDVLPGVGPSTAQKIVDYRSKVGSFKSIEELKNVSGIGDAKFNALKDRITAP
jgi:competence protein ComEA